MKTYDIANQDGKLLALEVGNFFLGRRGFCKIIKAIPGAQIKKAPRFLSWPREEEFCEFEFDGEVFVALEPFGDNSRYWVGPKSEQFCPQTKSIKAAFEKHKLLFGLLND